MMHRLFYGPSANSTTTDSNQSEETKTAEKSESTRRKSKMIFERKNHSKSKPTDQKSKELITSKDEDFFAEDVEKPV